MPRSVQHWPGGIPSSIKPHPETDLSWDQIKEEVKGWLLFVQVSAAAVNNCVDDYELHQRRQLVEKWASATQEMRDSYQSRAPIGLPGTEGPDKRGPIEGLRYPAEALEHIYDTLQPEDVCGLVSLVPIDEAHAANRARWVKFAIMLYDYDIETGHCLLDNYMPSKAATLNPATIATNSSIEAYLPWKNLETANFLNLTQNGTVLYLRGNNGPHMLVDEEGLKTGRLSMVKYEINGTVEEALQIRPFNMRWPYLYKSEITQDLDRIRHVQDLIWIYRSSSFSVKLRPLTNFQEQWTYVIESNGWMILNFMPQATYVSRKKGVRESIP
ncbi:hypothetical protein N7466_008766 [Penicillium verhagenii]|uniref:uncharacterized protein n=1 Tax=Penicillium verhagenii TaxID=1562060 RepID=UPI002544F7FB|nr:uncharacterized protein N7466_008766 [Penicillium verhagenii]KAJ5924579.1 hypothetical protein N7466_008766 [Penicillium verhagenii]